MKTLNAKTLPKVYYGLHMVEGVAEYREEGKQPYRICILENTIKKMDATFQGKPVFVLHSEDDLKDILEDIQELADGYVIKSFFNQADGKHWAEFIVVSDKGHQAIQNGWKLSNAYIPQTVSKNGQWHGVDYQREVVDGNYDHLAIVPNPRYEESIVYTPEQFKAYNDAKFEELQKVANSKDTKGESKMKALNFFRKQKVDKIENGADLETLSVKLPKSGKEFTIVELVDIAEKIENMAGYANGDHMVKLGEEEMSVNDMMKKYGAMCNEMAEMKKNMEGEDSDEAMENKEDEVDVEDKDEKKEKKKENGSDKADEEVVDEEVKEVVEEQKKANFKKLKNAHAKATAKTEAPVLLLSGDRVALGKSRYGSK